MRKFSLILLYFVAVANIAFAQRFPVVGIIPIEAAGTGVTSEQAEEFTSQVIAELNSWGTLTVVDGENAEFVVRSTLSRQGNNFVLSAETIETRTGRRLSTTTEQAASLNDISVFAFSTGIIEGVPVPNYLIGTWQSIINMRDGPLVSIIEFRADRTVRVERYDTWEHRQGNSLRYEGFGTGTYSYAGFFSPRTMTINNQPVQIDAMLNIHLRLEETLPEQAVISRNRLGIIFNSDKTSFELVGGHLPCGRNYDGPSVHPSAVIGFTHFTRIR